LDERVEGTCAGTMLEAISELPRAGLLAAAGELSFPTLSETFSDF
jgi:hypothetical protein